MRRKFSDKYGYTSVRDKLQIENIDDRLQNRLWVIIEKIIMNIDTRKHRVYNQYYIKNEKDYDYFSQIYEEYFAFKDRPSNEINNLKDHIRELYFSFTWYEVYNFVEVLVEFHPNEEIANNIKKHFNLVLEQEMSAYRLINDCIAPIVDEVEIKEIEQVFENNYSSVKGHLAKALELWSDRNTPDYINSIKESISAVESIVNIVIGRTNVSLNKGLQTLPFEIDNNFKQGMIRLYSWTSSSDGIRHGAHDGEILSGFDEAKYMLVSCSAFINYLISKYEKRKS